MCDPYCLGMHYSHSWCTVLYCVRVCSHTRLCPSALCAAKCRLFLTLSSYPLILFSFTDWFSFRKTSGFFKQLFHIKRKGYHWSSQTGADMVRFFLPSIFPEVKRLLYLDNDVIVSCCLEMVYHTAMKPGKIVGIVLDDLRWAARQQFTRHYNATHPLFIQSIRRPQLSDPTINSTTQYALLHSPVDVEEFIATVGHGYPNDGVILFDVSEYNRLKIMDILVSERFGAWVRRVCNGCHLPFGVVCRVVSCRAHLAL
jgi:Glycosyl transferase family 8